MIESQHEMVEESRNEIAVNEACLYEQRRKYRNTNIFESESSMKKRLEKERKKETKRPFEITC